MKENPVINMFEQALELLRSSKSIQDLRNIGEKFVEIQVEALKAHFEWLKQINQMPDAEKKKGFEVVGEYSNLMQEMMGKMEEEAQRFYELNGGTELMDGLGNQLQELSGSTVEGIQEQMNLILDSVMGNTMESMGEVMTDALSSFDSETEVDISFEDDQSSSESGSLKCPECGFEGRVGDTYCLACGKELG